MENEFLSVEIQPNGGVSLTDKSQGRVYQNLNLLEDDPDLGDGWNHGYAVHRQRVISGGGGTRIEVDCDTPLQTSFIVRQELDLPEAYDEHRNARSGNRVRMVFQSRITLRAGARFLDIESEVRNPAEDHRLCLVFPTGVESDSYLTDAAFEVIERSVALPSENHLQAEMDVDMKPQRSWTAISDAGGGLAVVCGRGLHEATVQNRPDRPIVLTAFRSTGKTVFTDGEPGGQMRGDLLRFTYRLVPVEAEIDRASLFRHGQDLLAGIRARYFDAIDVASAPTGSDVADKSLLCVGGGAVLSSFLKVGEDFELRLFNPSEEPIQASVDLHPDLNVSEAVFVNLESVPLDEASPPLNGGSLHFELTPKKFRTLSLKRNGKS
jgi:alpha-mannosidase/mannosylglycerate hydrolase